MATGSNDSTARCSDTPFSGPRFPWSSAGGTQGRQSTRKSETSIASAAQRGYARGLRLPADSAEALAAFGYLIGTKMRAQE